MKLSDFRIRDPYILLSEGKYYMYGTTRIDDEHSSPEKYGFDVYVSDDLEEWEGPISVFEPPLDFPATRNFWAPEVYEYCGEYYMLATFRGLNDLHGMCVLRSASPLGPFKPHSKMPITPEDWSSLDGALHISEDGKPYLVFCHEWWQINDGTICSAEMSKDLSCLIEEPKVMLSASSYPFVSKTSKGWGYITDGPCLYKSKTGELFMLWSSKGERGYIECATKSSDGTIFGDFSEGDLVYDENGGHGMIFKDKENRLHFVLHTPNSSGDERAKIFDFIDNGNSIKVI